MRKIGNKKMITIIEPETTIKSLTEEERLAATRIPENYDAGKFERPSLTCDIVIFSEYEGTLLTLLVKRKGAPFKGFWALPGGFANANETLEESARRELQEETNVKSLKLHQFGAYGDPGRDPRTWVVSVGYLALIPWDLVEKNPPFAGDDAAEVAWAKADPSLLPHIAFDHTNILKDAISHVRNHMYGDDILSPLFTKAEIIDGDWSLIPQSFNENHLVRVYKALNPSNSSLKPKRLMSKLQSSGILMRVPPYKRPRLYRFS